MPAFGVNVDDDTAEWLEDQRIRFEDGVRKIVSRSQVIREQLIIGRAVSEVLESAEYDVPPGRDRAAHARQAMLNLVREEESRD